MCFFSALYSIVYTSCSNHGSLYSMRIKLCFEVKLRLPWLVKLKYRWKNHTNVTTQLTLYIHVYRCVHIWCEVCFSFRIIWLKNLLFFIILLYDKMFFLLLLLFTFRLTMCVFSKRLNVCISRGLRTANMIFGQKYKKLNKIQKKMFKNRKRVNLGPRWICFSFIGCLKKNVSLQKLSILHYVFYSVVIQYIHKMEIELVQQKSNKYLFFTIKMSTFVVCKGEKASHNM